MSHELRSWSFVYDWRNKWHISLILLMLEPDKISTQIRGLSFKFCLKIYIYISCSFTENINFAGGASICSREWPSFHGNLSQNCSQCQWDLFWNRWAFLVIFSCLTENSPQNSWKNQDFFCPWIVAFTCTWSAYFSPTFGDQLSTKRWKENAEQGLFGWKLSVVY